MPITVLSFATVPDVRFMDILAMAAKVPNLISRF